MTAGNVKRSSKKINPARSNKSRSLAEEQLRIVKAAAQLGIHDYDIRTGKIQWDDRVCEIWGVNADEPISYEKFIAGIHPDDRDSTQQAVDRALDPKGSGTYRAVCRVINRVDGNERWVEATGQVVFENEEPVRLIGTVLDITDRKRAELDLAQSHRKMSEILGSIQDDFYVLDRNWRFVYASRLFTSKVGKEPEDLVGHNIWDMFPKHLGTVFEENLRAAMEQGEVRRFEISGKYTNAWYRMTAFPSAEGITVLGRDITERKQTEQELSEKQSMLQSFYDSVPLMMGIAEIDGDSIVSISGNRAAAEFFGTRSQELPDKLGFELNNQENSEELWLQKYRQSHQDGAPVRFEYEHRHPNGPRWLQATVTFLGSGPTGRPRFSFVAEEFTARKRNEMNLAFLDELNQDISRLSSTNEIMQTSGAKLGARLNLDTCQLVDIDEENDASYIFYVWNASDTQPVYGFYRISEFLEPEFYRALHAGSVVTVSDTMHDPRTRAEGYAKTNVLSFVTVPFHRSEKWKFLISCTASEVRHWRPDEIELIQEFAHRIFPRLERARAEEALRESDKQLHILNETLEHRVKEKTEEVRRLASDLVIAVQQERQRISHLLHDDLQQRIYALQMQLKYLRDVLESRADPIAQDVVQAETELHDILQLTRQISIDLSPPILPGEGLSHAISWLSAQLWQRYGLAVEIEANGSFELSNEELHVLLFNCVRELLFNVVKHADTHRVFVSLQWVDEILQIEVRDEGKGFNLQDIKQPSDDPTVEASFGLPSIRHQLSLFAGHMDINSEPGKGTHVVLTVPITESN